MDEKIKRENFKRLATVRTNKIINMLRTLGNCANRSAYEYSEEDVKKIFSEIEGMAREVKAKFYFPRRREFKL